MQSLIVKLEPSLLHYIYAYLHLYLKCSVFIATGEYDFECLLLAT